MSLLPGSPDALANSAFHGGLLVVFNAGGALEVRFSDYLIPEEEKCVGQPPMSSKVSKLVATYRRHLTVPWQAGLAAMQQAIFAVYDKSDASRLRANTEESALVTQQAVKQWLLIDVTDAFPGWMAAQEYHDAYFECPEDLAGYPEGQLFKFVADLVEQIETRIRAEVTPETVVALMGVGALFGLPHLSTIVGGIKDAVPSTRTKELYKVSLG